MCNAACNTHACSQRHGQLVGEETHTAGTAPTFTHIHITHTHLTPDIRVSRQLQEHRWLQVGTCRSQPQGTEGQRETLGTAPSNPSLHAPPPHTLSSHPRVPVLQLPMCVWGVQALFVLSDPLGPVPLPSEPGWAPVFAEISQRGRVIFAPAGSENRGFKSAQEANS